MEEADDLYSTMITQDLSGLEPKIASLISRLSVDTVVQKGILYKIIKGKKLIYPKPCDRILLVLKSHHEVGHSGFAKTMKNLHCQYYWESMTFDVTDALKKCVTC